MEKAVKASGIDITGKCILLVLLSESNANTAEIPLNHTPTFSDLEKSTSASRSTLVEWMRALTAAGWVRKLSVEGGSRAGYALSVGDPNACREPRKRAAKAGSGGSTPALFSATDADEACRQAVQGAEGGMPPGDTSHAARRYAPMPPGDTPDDGVLIRNSPTESSTTGLTLNPELFDQEGSTPAPTKKRRPRKPEEPRDDVQQICEYLVDHVVSTGSKRPTISDKWRTEARLLLDENRTPKATPERVIALINWIKTNEWWRAKVLSMPKLRANYDEIRLDAVRDFNRKQGRLGGYSSGYPDRNGIATRDVKPQQEPAEVRKARGWLDVEVTTGGDLR